MSRKLLFLSVNQRRAREVLITYCVCDHLFQTDIKHDVTVPEKNMEFNLLISDSFFLVSYKSEMLIIEMTLVIKH